MLIEVAKDGGAVVQMDREAFNSIGLAAGSFFGMVQGMTTALDRISRLPVVGLRFERGKVKGARRGKRARA
jgi:hypothetical protein